VRGDTKRLAFSAELGLLKNPSGKKWVSHPSRWVPLRVSEEEGQLFEGAKGRVVEEKCVDRETVDAQGPSTTYIRGKSSVRSHLSEKGGSVIGAGWTGG